MVNIDIYAALEPAIKAFKGELVGPYGAVIIFSEKILDIRSVEDLRGFNAFCQKLEAFCWELTRKDVHLPKGYVARFEQQFELDPGGTFNNPHLIIRNANSEMVGGICFKVGMPMEIITAQGIKGNNPREFYKDTGKHFEEVLIDRMISLTHKHFPERATGKPPKPKVIFKFDGQQMDPAMKRRILRKYCPLSIARGNAGQEPARVKEKFFARLRRKETKVVPHRQK